MKSFSHSLRLRFGGLCYQNVLTAMRYYIKRPSEDTRFFLFFNVNRFFLGSAPGLVPGQLGKYFSPDLRGDIYDFDLATMPVIDPGHLEEFYYEYLDLILPYRTGGLELGSEGTYEKFGLYVHEKDVVIDAGANMGLFTAYALNRGAGEVHAFEPVEENFEILKKTIAVNLLGERVVPVKKALSQAKETASISAKGTSSSLVMMKEGDALEEIQTIALDEYVEEQGLERVDFIKADIEGAERLLLQGAMKTLGKFKPALAICTYHLPDDREVLTELILKANPAYEIHYTTHKLYAR
ncbi:MAG: hypothetical protein AVO33_04185 [delta proteobacterium ML8_F1]|nr:MAG: hypothetical protein AVO33_04185 [delta proteobacterium ML8_F1]